MSFPNIIYPLRRPGRTKCPIKHLLAIEYLLTPEPRPYGLQKSLAYANGVNHIALNTVIKRIERRIKNAK